MTEFAHNLNLLFPIAITTFFSILSSKNINKLILLLENNSNNNNINNNNNNKIENIENKVKLN